MVTPLQATAAKPKKSVDYSRIDPGWRAGILSPRQLAEIYTQETGISVSHAAIIKHFTKLEIPRDLAAKIRAKAEALVTERAVTEGLRVTESVIIEANATLQANLIRTHRTDIGRYRKLAQSMLDELEVITGEPLNLEALILAVGQNEPSAANQLSKLAALPTRIKGLSDLSATLKTLVGLERQAFGIAENAEGDKPSGGGAATVSAVVDVSKLPVEILRALAAIPVTTA